MVTPIPPVDPIELQLERAAADAGVAWKEGRGSGEDMHVALEALIAHRTEQDAISFALGGLKIGDRIEAHHPYVIEEYWAPAAISGVEAGQYKVIFDLISGGVEFCRTPEQIRAAHAPKAAARCEPPLGTAVGTMHFVSDKDVLSWAGGSWLSYSLDVAGHVHISPEDLASRGFQYRGPAVAPIVRISHNSSTEELSPKPNQAAAFGPETPSEELTPDRVCRPPAEHEGESDHVHHFLDADRTGTKCILCGQYRHALYPDERSNCSTSGAIYSVGRTNAHTIELRVDLPFPIDAWIDGRFAVTDGPKVKRYEQAYTERQRISDLFHDALEPAIAQVYAEHGKDTKASVASPSPEIEFDEGAVYRKFCDIVNESLSDAMTCKRFSEWLLTTFKSPPSPIGEQVDPTDEAIDKWRAEFLPMSTASEISPFVLRAIVRSAFARFRSPARTVSDEQIRRAYYANIFPGGMLDHHAFARELMDGNP